MPGINQLKKFIQNITSIGNEPEVRAKRGEPYIPLSLPANIKDVEDAALLLNLLAGHDPKDSTSVNIEKKDYTKALVNDVKGMRIGLPKEYLGEGINEEVKQAILDVAKKYEEMGAIVEDCSFEVGQYATSVYYIIACAEASSNLGRFDGIRYGYRTEKFDNLKDIYKNSRSEGFGEEVKRRIMLGTYVLSSGYYDAYYKKAQKVRTVITDAYNELFGKYDLLLTPTSPTTAFKIGEKCSNPVEMYLADICTVPVNIGGLPGMSVPCAIDSKGLPIGFQLLAKPFDEEKIINEINSEIENILYPRTDTPLGDADNLTYIQKNGHLELLITTIHLLNLFGKKVIELVWQLILWYQRVVLYLVV